MEDKNIIVLKKRCKFTYKEQCFTYEDYIRIDFTRSTLNRMSEELKSNEDFLQVLADELLEDIDDIKEQILYK